MAVPNMLPALLKEQVIPVNATKDSQITVTRFQGEFVSKSRIHVTVLSFFFFFKKTLYKIAYKSFPSPDSPLD